MKIYFPLLLILICHSSFAEEHDGAVNITGTIQDNTCEVSPDSQNKTVNMGTVAAGKFSETGDFSSATHLFLELQDCGPAASEATVTFSGIADTQNAALFAVEADAYSARGIALGIYDGKGKRIAPGETSDGVVLTPRQGSVELGFSARYEAVMDNVTAGSANVIVTFVVNYL